MNTLSNTVTLIGYLTKQVRVSEHDGRPFANFTVVTNSPGGKDRPEIAEFHDCTLWGPLVPAIEDRLKGSPQVIVQGALRYKPVKDGKLTHKNPYINIREIYITGNGSQASK